MRNGEEGDDMAMRRSKSDGVGRWQQSNLRKRLKEKRRRRENMRSPFDFWEVFVCTPCNLIFLNHVTEKTLKFSTLGYKSIHT